MSVLVKLCDYRIAILENQSAEIKLNRKRNKNKL